jgi:hypothetical protein
MKQKVCVSASRPNHDGAPRTAVARHTHKARRRRHTRLISSRRRDGVWTALTSRHRSDSRGDGVIVPLDAVDAAPSNTKIQGRRYARGHAGPSPEKPGEARHDAAERGPLPDGRQRRGDAAFELFHLFRRQDDARLLVWSFDELWGWLELQRGCVCCAEEEALGS